MKHEFSKIKPWQLLSSRPGPEVPLFDIEIKRMQNPRNQAVLDAIVLHARDTINVVALDQHGGLILVRQYRFGLDQVIEELPAGLMDANEEPLAAAQRELQEETGYASDDWKYLGVSYLNPAYVTNCCHHFLAKNCQKVSDTDLDELEDMQLVIIKSEEIGPALQNGIIKDSVGKAAIHYVFPPPHYLSSTSD